MEFEEYAEKVVKDVKDDKPFPEKETIPDDEVAVGNYVITKDSLGLVIGKSSDNSWVVEWPSGPNGEVEYAKHSNDDIVVINVEDDE